MASKRTDYYYYCFQLWGLTCEDAIDPEKFLFHDATLLMGRQMSKLYYPDSDRDSTPYVYIEDATQYLVVRLLRRRNEGNDEMLLRAKKRSRELIAGIALPLLAYSDFQSLPGLSTEVYHSEEDRTIYFHANGYARGVRSEYYQALPVVLSARHFSRERLVELLDAPPYRWLTRIILQKGGENDWTRSVRLAASLVYRSINYPTSSTQFFGCYSAMEVLLDFGKQGGILDRAKILLGHVIYDDYYLDRSNPEKHSTLTEIRNHVAHRGDDCSKQAVYACVRLAMNVLLTVARHHTLFRTKTEMCRTLDFIHGIEQEQGADPFDIRSKWEDSHDKECLWQWMPARTVFLFGLSRPDAEQDRDRFLVDTGSALYAIQQKAQVSKEQAFGMLHTAMYVHPMPFPSWEEAWRFVDDRFEEVRQRAKVFLAEEETEVQ